MAEGPALRAWVDENGTIHARVGEGPMETYFAMLATVAVNLTACLAKGDKNGVPLDDATMAVEQYFLAYYRTYIRKGTLGSYFRTPTNEAL